MPALRRSEWRPGPGIHWESWSQNGDVCIAGLDPPFAGGASLASGLTWLMRSVASHCRRTHDATGALAFTSTGPRMPSTTALAMAMSFELALRDPRLIRERVRRRGGDPAARAWPAFWLEGTVYEYVFSSYPLPPGRTPRHKLILLAEERQVFVPAPAAKLAAHARRAWASGLDALGGTRGTAITGLLDEDECAFLANLLVLVHTQPARKVSSRPPIAESYRRHEDLIAELAPSAEAKRLPLAWHALWRLPPAMTWMAPGGTPWMRYPAVSFAAAARPLGAPG